jgi:hypothetical protein
MNVYEITIPPMKKMLLNLDSWIALAIEHAQKKSFDPNVLLHARLAPDMFSFTRQVQSACDAAKSGAARLTGKEPPKHPDVEQTMDELRARIRTCVAYLDTFTANDFANAETHRVELPFLEGKFFVGRDYLLEMSLPNFYFHAATAYAILRHNGVDLGKRNYLGSMTLHDR